MHTYCKVYIICSLEPKKLELKYISDLYFTEKDDLLFVNGKEMSHPSKVKF